VLFDRTRRIHHALDERAAVPGLLPMFQPRD
jgi:hypothetical protein